MKLNAQTTAIIQFQKFKENANNRFVPNKQSTFKDFFQYTNQHITKNILPNQFNELVFYVDIVNTFKKAPCNNFYAYMHIEITKTHHNIANFRRFIPRNNFISIELQFQHPIGKL